MTKASLAIGAAVVASAVWALVAVPASKPARPAPLSPEPGPTPNPDPILVPTPIPSDPWHAALARAKQDGKQVFIHFGATWCGPCAAFERTLAAPNVAVLLRGYVVLAVDVDHDTHGIASHVGLGKAYRIPAYFVVDANGKTLQQGRALRTPEQFVQWLGGARDKDDDTPPAHQRHSAKSDGTADAFPGHVENER